MTRHLDALAQTLAHQTRKWTVIGPTQSIRPKPIRRKGKRKESEKWKKTIYP